MVYVPIPPPAAKYLVRKSPGNGRKLPTEPLAIVPLNVTLVRLVQSSNTQLPIDVTLAGMIMLVRLVQYLNTVSPIVVSWLPAANVMV